jgi:cytochrome c
MRRTCVAAAFAALCACRSTPPPQGGPVERGRAIFSQECAACHDPDSRSKKIGPGLKGLFRLDKLSDGSSPDEANVRALIDRGRGGMPAFGAVLGDSEKSDLIAYLKAL